METYEEMLKTCIQRLETIDYYKLKKEYREFEDFRRSYTIEELLDGWRRALTLEEYDRNCSELLRQHTIGCELFNVWVNYDDILDGGDVIRPERRYRMAKEAIEALDKLIELGYDMTKITKE